MRDESDRGRVIVAATERGSEPAHLQSGRVARRPVAVPLTMTSPLATRQPGRGPTLRPKGLADLSGSGTVAEISRYARPWGHIGSVFWGCARSRSLDGELGTGARSALLTLHACIPGFASRHARHRALGSAFRCATRAALSRPHSSPLRTRKAAKFADEDGPRLAATGRLSTCGLVGATLIPPISPARRPHRRWRSPRRRRAPAVVRAFAGAPLSRLGARPSRIALTVTRQQGPGGTCRHTTPRRGAGRGAGTFCRACTGTRTLLAAT